MDHCSSKQSYVKSELSLRRSDSGADDDVAEVSTRMRVTR